MSIANKQIVPAFRRSGKTQEDFCAEHGVSIHKLRYYLYKRTKRVKPLLPERQSEAPVPHSVSAPSFISFDSPSTDGGNTAMRAITIINGRFSISELGQILRTMMGAPC